MDITRFRNHLRFNLTCFKSHVTPKYLRLQSSVVKGSRANNIIKRAERSLLNERIRQTNFTLDVLKEKHRIVKDKLRGELPEEAWIKVTDFIDAVIGRENHQVKTRQIKKHRALVAEKENADNRPVSKYERPLAVALASSACVDKTTKIITEFTRKDLFCISNERIKYCNRYNIEVN